MCNFIKCIDAKCLIYLIFFLGFISPFHFERSTKYLSNAAKLSEYISKISSFGESDDSSGAQIRRRRAANTFCIAPVSTPDKTISYSCPGEDSSPCSTNGFLRQFTIATIQCTQNYFPIPDTNFQSICNGRNWSPPIDRCFKKCEKLKPVNVDLQCFRKGVNIACDEHLMLAGTKVRPKCKQLYKYKDFVPTYQEIVCDEDGKWDKGLFSCVPECGRSFVSPETLIANGVEERFGDSPWHVAIYNQNKVLICGGTIISPQLVLSAAHCFYDRVNNLKLDPVNYEVVVSKVTRNYSEVDNKYQKVFKINEIRYSDKGFVGLDNYYTADIVALILQEKITLSPAVLPACVEWIPVMKPPEGTLGKVSGWGMNERGRYSERLLTANLPFISRGQCLDTVPTDFKPYITLDKFCAGSDKGGPSVLQGDSGGGLMFQSGGVYYIRGLVSLKQPTSTAISAFTDIADHIEWILSIRNAIEQTTVDGELVVPSQKIPSECGLQKSNFNDDSTPWHVSIYNVTENRVACGGTIISSRLILSAAHCFNLTGNLSQYEVVMNKVARNEKTYKIKELRFFTTDSTALDYDIVVLITSENIIFNSEISPACVEWTRTSEFRAPEGTLGKFMGWDWNRRNGTATFLSQSLPFMSHDHCAEKLYSSHFKSLLTFDKFCADLKPLPYFAPSRGSGVIFQQDTRNYVRGIMSVRPPAQVGIALFTDISYYINFITAVLNDTE